MVISIHAIATFQALHDYLRPRVSGVSSGSRSPGILPTLAASGFTSGSSSRNAGEEPPQAPLAQHVALEAVEHSSEPTASTAAIGRRRSLRLSAKHSGTPVGAMPASTTDESAMVSSSERIATQPSDPAASAEAALSDTVVESELQADFTDDEVEAEVFRSLRVYFIQLMRYPGIK
jgi:E3 ubiquitin-protein ligase TRIP12